MGYARPALSELVAQAIDQGRGELDSVVDQAVAQAAPKIKQVVLDTAQEALQSGALQEMAATTKKQLMGAFLVSSLFTIAGVALVLKKMKR